MVSGKTKQRQCDSVSQSPELLSLPSSVVSTDCGRCSFSRSLVVAGPLLLVPPSLRFVLARIPRQLAGFERIAMAAARVRECRSCRQCRPDLGGMHRKIARQKFSSKKSSRNHFVLEKRPMRSVASWINARSRSRISTMPSASRRLSSVS